MPGESARAVSTLFDAERLKLARQTAGLRKNELAGLVELSPAAITQYEQGQTRPRPNVVAALALALNQPVDYFLQDGRPIQRADVGTAFFRSLRSTRQIEREQAAAKATFVWEVAVLIEEQADLPPVTLPDLAVPEDADRQAVEQVAADVRIAWDLGQSPIAHVVRTMETHGVVVARLGSTSETVDAYSQRLSGRPIVILWDGKRDAARSRFDAAHELGHLVMHHDPEPGNKRHEDQAQAFASALLMPEAAVLDHLPRRAPRGEEWDDLFDLKARFGVSAQAILYRAKTLGTLTPQAHRRSMIMMSERGWRTQEPGDLGPPERPILLAHALDLLEAHRDFDVKAAAQRLRVSPARVLEVIGTTEPERVPVTL